MVVTEDGRTAGDALTYVSELIVDGDVSNDELAKNLAEMVNNQETIPAGIIPDGNVLYRTAGEDQPDATPQIFALYPNYPNPFNPSTVISFALPKDAHVTLAIFNVIGQRVSTLVDERVEAGRYQISWDASGLPSGVYYYQLKAEGFVRTNKMILAK
jgi:hypothetical protein